MNEPSGADPYEPPRSLEDGVPMAGGRRPALPWTPMDAITFGWETLKRRPWLAAAMFLAALAGGIPSMAANFVFQWSMKSEDPAVETLGAAIYVSGTIVGLVVSLWMMLGISKVSLELARGRAPAGSEVFAGGPLLSTLGAWLVMALAVGAGFVLCIVPGVILLLGWYPWMFVLLDRRTGPIESLAQSWRLTDGHKLSLGVFLLLWIALSIAAYIGGLLLLCVGILVTLPAVLLVLSVAQAWIYLKLSGEEPRLVDQRDTARARD